MALLVHCSADWTLPSAKPTPDGAVSAVTLIAFQNGIFPDDKYTGAGDTYITASDPLDTPYASQVLFARGGAKDGGAAAAQSILLRFQLVGIPSNSRVREVLLTFTMRGSPAQPYAIAPLRTTWASRNANWNLRGSGGAWQIPGASGASDRGDAAVVFTPEGGIWDAPLTITFGPEGIAMVQDWIDRPENNNGLILYGLTSNTDDEFSTRSTDFTTDGGGPPARPKLTIRYSSP